MWSGVNIYRTLWTTWTESDTVSHTRRFIPPFVLLSTIKWIHKISVHGEKTLFTILWSVRPLWREAQWRMSWNKIQDPSHIYNGSSFSYKQFFDIWPSPMQFLISFVLWQRSRNSRNVKLRAKSRVVKPNIVVVVGGVKSPTTHTPLT